MTARDRAIWVNEEAADTAAHEHRDGPLAGLRLAVKDLFDIEGMVTGAGNPDWRADQRPAGRTAPVVERLLSAGAELAGKTQTDELAYSLNGANVHYGTPVNPAQPDRLPGGSSSGSAIAVAIDQADIGLGTDTGGSIRVPASYNGLYGLRPSHGVISLEGCVPLAPSFDTAGWMCRDAGTLYEVGQQLLPAGSEEAATAVVSLMPVGLEAGQQRVLEQALADSGFEPARHEPLDRELLERASRAFRTLQGRDIWRTHGDWITKRQPRFADDIAARFRWCAGLDADEERSAMREREALIEYLERVAAGGEYPLVLPTTPGAAPGRNTPAEALAGYRETLMGLTALAGLWQAPQLSMPLMRDEALPWGMSLLAAPGQDRRLLLSAL
ncbi:amidase [Kushneria aurantia]|uniref:Amidase n=1 Tax=Kushneria aurantia TaxID=504092 RepID=A0ABV6G487_9GAMM|nr:amidase [Kushneria aurantia]